MTTRSHLGLEVVALIVVAATSAIVTWSVTKADKTTLPNSDITECIQGKLQIAIEQGGGLAGTVPATFGYTFLVANEGAKTCELRGYPYEIIFSTEGGESLKVSIAHERTELYAQPKLQRVVLRPGGVGSFGVSFNYGIAPSGKPRTTCLAPLIDLRLPALGSHLFSYEFPVRMDVCEAGRRADVTPVEDRVAPKA